MKKKMDEDYQNAKLTIMELQARSPKQMLMW